MLVLLLKVWIFVSIWFPSLTIRCCHFPRTCKERTLLWKEKDHHVQWGARRGRKDLNSVHQKPKRQTLLFFSCVPRDQTTTCRSTLVRRYYFPPIVLRNQDSKDARSARTETKTSDNCSKERKRREHWLHGGWAAWRRTRWKEFHPQAVWCCSKRQRHVKPFSKAQLLGKGCRQKHTQAFFGVRSKNAPSAVLTSFGALCLSSDLLLSVFHHLSDRQPVHRSTRFVTRENGRDSRNTPTETGKTPTPKLSRPLHLFSIPKGQLA